MLERPELPKSKKLQKKIELDLKTFEIPYEERDHALYVTYGPYKNPRYALSILVEHGEMEVLLQLRWQKNYLKKLLIEICSDNQ